MKLRTEIGVAAELVVAAGVSALLVFAYIAYTARRLGPEANADFSSALSFIFVSTTALSTIAPAVSRVAARLVARGDLARAGALRSFVRSRFRRWTAVAIVVSCAAATPLARLFHFRTFWTPMLALLCAITFSLASIERGFLQGLGQFRTQNLNTVLEGALRLALAVVLLGFMQRAELALVAYLISMSVATALMLHGGQGEAGTGDDWREVVRLASPLLLLLLASAVFQNADMLAVKHWLPAGVAGQYGAASAITRAFGVLFVPLYILSGPMLVALHEEGRSIARPTLRLCGYFLALCTVPLALLTWRGRELTTFLYGPDYAEAGSIAAALSSVLVISCLTLLIAQARVTVGAFGVARIYAGFAVLQLALIAFMHDSVSSIITALIAVQGVLLLVVLAALFLPVRRADDSRTDV
ncbi:MAG TPA: lipopolysaccharide biosynthesis protein [Thermoanaerobaculia bacterium]|nr:lipopolysaccharide biosynthesis protein [Thermoanaerobaculia bacterium]